jgi:hypothetical protein
MITVLRDPDPAHYQIAQCSIYRYVKFLQKQGFTKQIPTTFVGYFLLRFCAKPLRLQKRQVYNHPPFFAKGQQHSRTHSLAIGL